MEGKEKEDVDYFHALPTELCDIIMLMAHNELDERYWAMFLAMTCKRERARYTRLIPADEKVIYRTLVVDLAYEEGTVRGPRGKEVLPGERGYDYFKKRETLEWNQFGRAEWDKPQLRAKDARKKKDRRRLNAQHKKRNYDE